ncbi:MAG: hypothetical protein AAF602_26080, partial [Myxococcota bacterium]
RTGVRLVGSGHAVLLMHAREDGFAARELAQRVGAALAVDVRERTGPDVQRTIRGEVRRPEPES